MLEDIILSADRIKRFAEAILQKLIDYPNFKKSFNKDELFKSLYEEVLYHEGIHMFLRKKFPGVSTDEAIMKRVISGIKLKVEVDPGKKFDLSGNFSPQMLHEVCAMGGQLMFSTSAIPIFHGVMLQDSDEFPPDFHYHLLYKLLPYVTLAKAPDSDYKRQMLNAFHKTGEAHSGDAVVLLGHPPFSRAHTVEVGKILYGIGYQGLQELERQYSER